MSLTRFVYRANRITRKRCGNEIVSVDGAIGIGIGNNENKPRIGAIYIEDDGEWYHPNPAALHNGKFPLIRAWRAVQMFGYVPDLTPTTLRECWEAVDRTREYHHVNPAFANNISDFPSARVMVMSSVPNADELNSMIEKFQLHKVEIDIDELRHEDVKSMLVRQLIAGLTH